jgi:hypothetical protein
VSDADCRETANSTCHQAPSSSVQRPIEAFVSAGSETVLEGESRRGSGFGKNLGILEVKPTAEREPCGGERKA